MDTNKDNNEQFSMKVVGKRKTHVKGLEAAEAFLKLVIKLRGNKLFIPKGIHKFKTFHESNEWSLKMMTRKQNQDPPK